MSGAAEAKEKEPEPKAEASEPAAESTQAAAEPAAEEAAAEAEPTVEEKLQARVEELEAENLEMVDRWKRSLADAENTRQMSQREIANAKKFAVQGFAKSMLDVCDNLALALEHTPEEERTGDTNPQLKVLFEGVEMTEKILLGNLEKHGVTRFNPVDEPFDPNVMMALFEMPVPDKEPGTVAQVVKTGFMLNDRVLRPADVGVVKKP
jgi:molecular chaperone GrpE